MVSLSIFLIELSLLPVAYNQVLTTNDETLESYNETSGPHYKSNLTEFLFTVSNTSFSLDSRFGRETQVDCFGLGKAVAMGLEWFFISKPNGTNALDVRFLLTSRQQPQRVQVITGKQFGLEWTDFRVERKTVVIVHGFLSHGEESWITDMQNAFLRWGDVNVVVVDWSSGSNTWNYYKAAVNTRVVGHQIARFFEHIENTTINSQAFGSDVWGPLHFVGHSLGAHICGFAGKELKKRNSRWAVERITGLDPAQPCFKTSDPMAKLHKNDAHFVDIIHTNGRLLSEFGLGLPQPIGDVDFYPNGGRSQPGCTRINTSYYKYLPIPVLAISKSICSHGRSYVYLTESLISDIRNNCTFWAHRWDLSYRNLEQVTTEPCDENICTEMGIRAINYSQRGTFFASTSDSIPYCVNTTRVIPEVRDQLQKDHIDELTD